MLILTRRAGERIMIGDDIVLTVVESGRDTVRIGIEAPRQVAVHRYEVYEQIVRENEAARASGTIADEAAPAPISAASVPRRSTRG